MTRSIAHVALIVRDYDEAIAWYTGRLGFTLVADDGGAPFALSGGQRSPTIQPEQDKRWVVVAPPGAPAGGASLLLARAATPEQEAYIGNQAGGRVFLFLATDDFARDHAAMVAAGVRFVREPKRAPYGTVAVFEDLYGNLWDLVQFGGTEGGDAAERRTDIATRLIHAAPEAIHRAFVDADALMAWLPPDGMSGRILLFEPKEGGRYRIELSYKDAAPAVAGKTSARSDVSHGSFLAIEPGRRIVQTAMFESDDPSFAGEMIVAWSFRDTGEGIEVSVAASNVPPGISRQDHEAGLASSLANLASFVERG